MFYNNEVALFMLMYFLSSGNLFHIDFGYILGRDPKPLPPPMKLSKEMVNIITSSLSVFIIILIIIYYVYIREKSLKLYTLKLKITTK